MGSISAKTCLAGDRIVDINACPGGALLLERSLLNISIEVRSEDKPFLEFVDWNLPRGSSGAVEEENVKLACSFLGYRTFFSRDPHRSSKFWEVQDPILVSAGVYLDDRSICWKSRRMEIQANEHLPRTQHGLAVRGTFYERPDHTLRRVLLRQKTYKYNNYQVVMRALIYSPLFWLAERHQGRYLLHAAGVERDGRGVILTGLNGVGKTSLALSMAQRGYSFLGDNYLLFDEDTVYAFPEAIRLPDEMVQTLGLEPIAGPKLFGKRIVPATQLDLVSQMDPHLFLLVVRGPRTLLRTLDLDTALEIVCAQADYLGEGPEHTYTGLAMLQNPFRCSDTVRWVKKLQATRALLSRCKVGYLQLGETEPIGRAIEMIEQFQG